MYKILMAWLLFCTAVYAFVNESIKDHYILYAMVLSFGLLIVAFYILIQRLKQRVAEQNHALYEHNLHLQEEVDKILLSNKQMEEAGNQLFHLSLHLLLIADFDGTIRRVNSGWQECLGYDEERLIGTSFFDLIHPDDYEKTVLEAQKISEGKKTIYFQNRYRHKDGSYRILEWSAIDVPSQKVIYAIARDVTEQVAALKSLEIANRTLESAQRISRVGYWSYDTLTKIPMWSEQIFLMLERDPTLGPPLLEEHQQIIHPDDWDEYLQTIMKAVDGEPFRLTTRFFTPSGDVRYIYNSGFVRKNEEGIVVELYGTSQDITSFKSLELALLKKTEAFERVILDSPYPMMLHNEHGKVLLLNHVWQEISGYDAQEIPTVDAWVEKAYPSPVHEKAKQHIRTLYDLERVMDEGEYSFYTKYGDKCIWRFCSAPSGMIDGARTVISSAMDVTEIRQKDELMLVQSKQAAMGEMIAMIAHQWRQPLTLISMASNTLLVDIELEKMLDLETAKKNIQRINEQTIYLSQTIEDFKNFFKNDKELTLITPEKLFDGVLALIGQSLANHEIEVHVSLHDNSEIPMLYNDMIQVILNLINNAKDAVLGKRIREPVIELIAQKEGALMALHVKDNGGGVPDAFVGKIFDPYFSTKSLNGTGLGLYICKSIVEKHMHGRIEYQSNLYGADFMVLLPLKG